MEFLEKYNAEGDATHNWDWYSFLTDFPELIDTPLGQAYRDLMLADFRLNMHIDALLSNIPGYQTAFGEDQARLPGKNLTERYFGNE